VNRLYFGEQRDCCTQLSFRVKACYVERSRNISHNFVSVNRLYCGDNLELLRDRREFPDASVDLVYLDPPLNSNAD